MRFQLASSVGVCLLLVCLVLVQSKPAGDTAETNVTKRDDTTISPPAAKRDDTTISPPAAKREDTTNSPSAAKRDDDGIKQSPLVKKSNLNQFYDSSQTDEASDTYPDEASETDNEEDSDTYPDDPSDINPGQNSDTYPDDPSETTPGQNSDIYPDPDITEDTPVDPSEPTENYPDPDQPPAPTKSSKGEKPHKDNKDESTGKKQGLMDKVLQIVKAGIESGMKELGKSYENVKKLVTETMKGITEQLVGEKK